MEFKQAVNYRQSVRYFTNRQIDAATLRDLIRTAARTPSWANSQPWKVYVATGDSLKKIKVHHLAAAQRGVKGNSDLPVAHRTQWNQQAQENMADWSTALQQYLGTDIQQMTDSQTRLYDAAALVYLTLPKGATGWSIYDLGAFGQTLMLAAADQRIDSMPAYEIVRYPDAVREIMGIPANTQLVMGIALGYRDPAKRINDFRSARAPENSILTIKD